MADIILKDRNDQTTEYRNVNSVTFNTTTPGETATFIAQKQADWNQTDTTAVDYIKNKPQDLATKDYVESHVKEKIDAIGIQEGVATEEYVQKEINDAKGFVQDLIDNIEIPDAQVQADWNQTDVDAKDFIKNRPFGKIDNIVKSQDITFTQEDETINFAAAEVSPDYPLIRGELYDVIWNHIRFGHFEAKPMSSMTNIPESFASDQLWIGNSSLFGTFFGADNVGDDTGEPFWIFVDAIGRIGIVTNDLSKDTHSVCVQPCSFVTKLPFEWLPNGLATEEYVQKEIAAIEIPEGGGGASTIPVEKDIFPTTSLTNFAFNSTYRAFGQEMAVDFILNVGEEYQVTWDDKTYTCVGQDGSALISGAVILGNAASFMLAGNEEEFVLGWIDGYAMFFSTVDTDPGVEHSIRIYQTGRAVADWNQNDINGEGYIHNRPCYVGDPVTKMMWPSLPLSFAYGGSSEPYMYINTPESGWLETWTSDWSSATVTWDGTSYICKPQFLSGVKFVGDIGLMMGGASTGEPFIIAMGDEHAFGSDMVLIYSLEDVPTDILPSQTLTFTAVDGTSYYSASVDTLSLVSDNEYLITYNGEHRLTATSYVSSDTSYVGVGNPSILGLGDNTGVAFFIYTATASDGTQSSAVVTTDGAVSYTVSVVYAPNVTHTVSLSLVINPITTIDPKFLGDVPWDKITNKPFGVIAAGAVVADESIVVSGELTPLTTLNAGNIVIGAQYDIMVNNVWYNGIGMSLGGLTGIMIANGSNEEVGAIAIEYGGLIVMSDTFITPGVPTDIKVTLSEDAIKKIDAKYLPDDLSGGSDLPEVGAEGQVMTVVNGAWAAQTPASGLPDVTESDAGKFLRVSANGIWTAEAVLNAEEVTF